MLFETQRVILYPVESRFGAISCTGRNVSSKADDIKNHNACLN